MVPPQIFNNTDDITAENARIKQLLNQNEYQENVPSKIFKIITSNHGLSQSQQQITQDTDNKPQITEKQRSE